MARATEGLHFAAAIPVHRSLARLSTFMCSHMREAPHRPLAPPMQGLELLALYSLCQAQCLALHAQ